MEPVKHADNARFGSPLFSGMVYAFITMAMTSLLYSFALTLTEQSESSLSFYAFLIHAFSIFVGSYVYGKRINNRGWYHGGILGLLYAVIIILIGFLTMDNGFTFNTLISLIAAYLVGAIGGILGVNQRK